MASRKELIQALLLACQHGARTNKSARRREAYAAACQNLQGILDNRTSFNYIHALYADLAMFETNPTKKEIVLLVKTELKKIYEASEGAKK